MCTTYDLQLVDAVVMRRVGTVLGRGCILFSDNVPGQTNLDITPRVFGTKNYRKADFPLVSGCGQPTLEAAMTILQLSGAKVRHSGAEFPNTKTLILCSLREEPVIYLNGRPFTVRKIDKPLENLSSFQGIDGDRVDMVEAQLKADILQECHKFRGLILVHFDPEKNYGAALSSWLYVNSENVMTTKEMSAVLKKENFLTECTRVPLVPKLAPNVNSFDMFMKLSREIFTEHSKKTVLFYCQSGRGRTTFSIVVLGLIYRVLYANLISREEGAITPSPGRKGSETVPISIPSNTILEQCVAPRKGEVKIILSLLRTFEHSSRIKKLVDDVIDESSAIQNIRDAILAEKMASDMATDVKKKKEHLQTALHFLQRYFYLIVFCKYLHDFKMKKINRHLKFAEWLQTREEIRTLASHLNDPDFAFGKAHTDICDEFSVAVLSRKGSVLSAGSILKVDRFHTVDDTALFPGYSKIENESVHSIGQCKVEEFQRLILYLQTKTTSSAEKQIQLINLRLDPHIFVNGVPLVLRTQDMHTWGMGLRGMTTDRLEKMELRLKTDIISELEAGKGRIVIHREDVSGTVLPSWMTATPGMVRTIREVFSTLISEGNPITYHRIPFSSLYPFSLEIFDELFKVLSSSKGNELVFISETGRSLSAFAKVAALLVQNFDSFEKSSTPHRSGNFNIIKKLVQVLAHGTKSKNFVDTAIDMSASFVNIRQVITSTYEQSLDETADEGERNKTLLRACYYLQGYAILVMFASYLLEKKEGHAQGGFYAWYRDRPELEVVLNESLEQHKIAFLEDDLLEFGLQLTMGEEDFDRVVRSRVGEILQCNMILKSDHFPGCQKSWLKVKVQGAPNFRCIPAAPIYGMGMPTKEGISNVMNEMKGSFTTLHWLSLREEPVLYINGKPYVLRDSAYPFRNLEYTGVSSTIVENMEEKLKQDIIDEAKRYSNHILLTGEKATGGDLDHPKPEDLVCYAYWEELSEIKTPRELVTELGKSAGVKLFYHRVPVTDEHSMEVGDFEYIIDLLINNIFANSIEDLAIMFHCQMGQGRTTTGMTLATLLWQLKDPNFLNPSGNHRVTRSQLRESQIIRIAIEGVDLSETEEDDDSRYMRGEYNPILDAVRAMGGPESKIKLDKAIDLCDEVQNLREAIHQYYIKSETHPHYAERALNYLRRYFFLLVVSQYIQEVLMSEEKREETITLSGWLESRYELQFLEKNLALQ
eukprot:TRINITY_DN3384_c0_g1_i1.p1 TRINITY_DN3384_c0_g1~~TRINITY_DN3384_c0_g1_i1.p1  ORF type:complete len:1219 (+),score=262.85 TRINITY_DN3384_c0_g1_i1:14-3670(+)